MKMHCPHCGVKGSADDSYRGKKVKCPKCDGMFKAVPEETVTTTPEDSPHETVLPAVPEEVVALPVEESSEVTSSTNEIKVSGSANHAPKVKLQWAQKFRKTELEKDTVETQEPPDSFTEPEQSAFSDDSADRATFDELEEIVVTGPSPDEAEADTDTEMAFDENSLDDIFNETDKTDTVGFIDETELINKNNDTLDEPQTVAKEQCWQCGKEESEGEPFIARDGRLYCTSCTPAEEVTAVDKTDSKHALSEPADYFSKFTIGGALREAWTKTKGAKASIWAGSAVMYLILLILFAGSAYLLPPLATEQPLNITNIVTNILAQTVLNILSVIFIAGLFYMGIRKVIKDPISWKMIFKGFSCAGKIVVVFILQSILISIGFLLLILPGIYLCIGYLMAVPLIVDRGLSPWQAMETSRKAIHKVWWRAAGLFLLAGGIILLSMIPLCIGLIWSWPLSIILVGVVYRYLFGIEKKS